eukprot:467986-Prymnesium_polylepis.1
MCSPCGGPTARHAREPPSPSFPQRGRRVAHALPHAASRPHPAGRPPAARSSTRGSAAPIAASLPHYNVCITTCTHDVRGSKHLRCSAVGLAATRRTSSEPSRSCTSLDRTMVGGVCASLRGGQACSGEAAAA